MHHCWSLLAVDLSMSPEKLFLGLQLKHCEDPVVIDDGDGPLDQVQEPLPAEPQSHLAKSQEAQLVALPQGPGLSSRLPGQLSGDPGRESGGGGVWGGLHTPPCALVVALDLSSSLLFPEEP